MAHRKEVFQSKVLQRLYPAAPKLKKEPNPPHIVEALAKKTCVKKKAIAPGDALQTQSATNPPRRMYTVLPPPVDYKTHSDKSVTLPQLESINSADDPAEESAQESNGELGTEQEEQTRKRRKRRKRKPALHQDAGQDGAAPGNGCGAGPTQAAVDDGGERISRNKKRKLKKKRHKEKLLSMGAMPRAAALEFTYQKEKEEEEEDNDNEERAAEVSDFLRTTLEIYMSDSSSRADELPFLSGAVDDLLSHISSGREPNAALKQLCSLRAFVRLRDADKLERALAELRGSSSMSAEETTAVISLFKYWITDILPMQADEKTGRATTTHP